MKSFLRLVVRLSACVLLLGTQAHAIVEYALHPKQTGDGPPSESYVFLSKEQACASVPGPFPDPLGHEYLGNIRYGLIAHVETCVFDAICVAAFCMGGNPVHQFSTGDFFWARTLTCPPTDFQQFASCGAKPPKTKGPPEPKCCKGNPVNAGTGNKYQLEPIYRANAAAGALALELHYNSYGESNVFQLGPLTNQWSARYFVSVRDLTQGIVGVQRADGREYEFRAPPSGNAYLRDADMNDRLEKLTDGAGKLTGWRYSTGENDEVEEFDAAGKLRLIRDRAGREQTMTYSTGMTPPQIAPAAGLLIAVSDPFGRQLAFHYNARKRLVKAIDPAGAETLIEHDGPSGPAGAGNITKITFADSAARTYHYAEAAKINGGIACSPQPKGLANFLTGITDENANRFATWTYDCEGRVTSSEHALGVDQYTFTYGAATTTFVDPLGASRSIATKRVLGITKSTGTTQPAASGEGEVSDGTTHDANGNVSSRTDFNGNRTNHTYDLARNLETSRTEGLTAAGATTPQTRTISTQWHATLRLPTGIAEPLRMTTLVYDPDGTQCGAKGALCSKTIQPTADASGVSGFSAAPGGTPRTWSYTYNANGSVLTADGPRIDVADVTTYTYYADNHADINKRGNVATITNAAGHATSVTAYNAHGQPLTVVDPNGLITTMTYDARLRLRTRTVGTETTTYDYDFAGQLRKVTLSDGSFISYTYDTAHRLTAMEDNLGNQIRYTLDAMGNRTAEEARDPANQLAQTRSRVFGTLNRLFRELGAQSQTTEYAYDDEGNVVTIKDPLNRITTNQYDALNRLRQVTSPAPISAVTQYAYNGLDALVQVTDPRSLVTGYTVDGLGNLTQQSSPDTGPTVNTHDAAGNLLAQTDAKSQTTTYAYDTLNRVTLITFHDGSRQTYSYDQGTNAIGRLSSITERDARNQETSAIAYAFDQHGRVTSETRTVAGVPYVVAYRYDISGRLDQLTYPSGRTVNYSFDDLGRVKGITTTKPGSPEQTVLSGISYHPFGGVKGYTFDNGQTYIRGIDLDGRIASYTLGTRSFGISYDPASRIRIISDNDNPSNRNDYDYDNLDRLTRAELPGGTTIYGYLYDAVGNRTNANGAQYTYSSTSNRLASITPSGGGPLRNFVFDLNGSTTADGNNTYIYDARGRMVQATSSLGATSYQVNALGQRIRKTNSLGDIVFHYDTEGRLIAETDPGGGFKRELIYLGDIPVGVVQ